MTTTNSTRAQDAFSQRQQRWEDAKVESGLLTDYEQALVRAVHSHVPAIAVSPVAPTKVLALAYMAAALGDAYTNEMRRRETAEAELRALKDDVNAMRRVLGIMNEEA